jgi:sugar lactone lactonase YvrE
VGQDLLPPDGGLPEVWLAGSRLRIAAASSSRLAVQVDEAVPGGVQEARVSGVRGSAALHVGRTIATGVHQVDSPVIDRLGRVYVTFSGSRGQQVPVSIFRLSAAGLREPFSSSVVNPTSMAIGPDRAVYVSSRFEGSVFRVGDDGGAEAVASNLGVACGLAFGPDGALYVGDRSGTIFRASVDSGTAAAIAQLPPSVAAFHLAFGPDGWLYVTAPTLSPADPVRRIDPASGRTEVVCVGLGRPQGIAFDHSGVLHVADALAGASGLYRIESGRPRLVIGGRRLVGVAFDPDGGVVVASSDTLYRFDHVPGASAPAPSPIDQDQ